ncbi:MAG: BrxA/BrxB family bacilliredoxin [Ignavibacteria bacterium]|nr:BrxA/BrxB family bacilliredoxin [Ignavibacteriales bacterium]MBN8584385.1 BrxA/BrxB family bacilliredoxin [Ignavibacteria bacterium]
MFQINTRGPIYDPEAVQPMRDELTAAGFVELLTPADVDTYLGVKEGTTLVMINSVCGCAAGSARPGVTLALQNKLIPNRIVTAFAGQDRDAVDHLRNSYLPGIPPSSPFMALFKDGELVYLMQRMNIEGKTADMVAEELTAAFDKHCTFEGPSVPKEQYDAILHAKACGSKIPKYSGN